MTATKKAKKHSTQKRDRRERRFSPEETYASRVTVYAGMFGAFSLGAGVYAQWIRQEPLSYGAILVGVGGVIFGWALWKGSADVGHVRVGDAGVAVEKGNDLVRVLWCDIERASVEDGSVVVRGKAASLSFPVEAHPKAAAWLVAEGGRRVPDIMAFSRTDLERLPETKEFDGELVALEELQIAGRACRSSGKPIAFERDARLCPTCGESYLRNQVPKKCLTCQAELGTRAREA